MRSVLTFSVEVGMISVTVWTGKGFGNDKVEHIVSVLYHSDKYSMSLSILIF